jgi:hypothetical protein
MKKVLMLVAAAVLVLAAKQTGLCVEARQSMVSFSAPADWKLLKAKSTDKVTTKLYLLRKDKIGSAIHPSNALLQYYPVPASATIGDADGIVASHFKDATLILQAQDEPDWKTYLLVYSERNQQYIVLNRIGILDGMGVELMLSFPLLQGKESEPLVILTLNEIYVQNQKMAGVYCRKSTVADMVNGFNSACRSLKISNKGEYKADAVIINPPSDVSEIYRYNGDANTK